MLEIVAAVRKERKAQLGREQGVTAAAAAARAPSLPRSSLPCSTPIAAGPNLRSGPNASPAFDRAGLFHESPRQREGECARLGGAKVPGVESQKRAWRRQLEKKKTRTKPFIFSKERTFFPGSRGGFCSN